MSSQEIQALAERIANGETIDLAAIPEAIRDTPEVQRLLAIARVTHVLDSNLSGSSQEPTSGVQIGPWRLLHVLGSGGMGEVWLAERRDGVVEQRVAVKRVRAQNQRFRDRLLSERRILARLEHPNIARFIDAGVDANDSPWFALEYVEGKPITEWCSERALPLRARLQLFQKVCAAVSHAHRHLVVHRDLKPSNVLVNTEGEVKLLDFGIAKLLDGSDDGNTVGALTPAYAAPEQLRGEVVSTATDVYVLGLLLFRILAGALPQTRTSEQLTAVLAHIDEEETQRPSSSARTSVDALPYPANALEGDLDAIVAQAIRAQPEARYASPADFSADIGRYLEARPVRARVPSRWYLFSRFARRNRVPLALAVCAMLALLVGTVVSMKQAQRADREAISARQQLARAERVSEFLGSLYREQDPLSRDAASARPPAALVADAIARVETELADDPRSQAQLLRVLGDAQMHLSELEAAHKTLDLAASKVANTGNALLSAEIDALRGAVARRELRNEEAEEYFAQALRQASLVAGSDSIEVGRINAISALTLVQLSRFKDARAAAGSAHEVLAKKLGVDHPETIAALVALGTVQEQLREDVQALISLRSAIALIEQHFGPGDARLVQPLLRLAEVLRRERDFAESRTVLDRGAEIARQQLGERSVWLADILITRSRMESEAGESASAIAALDAAELAVPESEVGARAQLLAGRGKIWIELKDGKRAEPDLRTALKLRRETGGLRSGIAWFSQAELGWALALQGRFEEAHALHSEAEREMQSLLGPDAYQNALISIRRASAFVLQGDWRNAVFYFRKSIVIEEKIYGPDHYLHFSWSLGLAQALSKLNDGQDEATRIADALIERWSENSDIARDYAELMLLRCDLYAHYNEHAAAHVLAEQTLARPGLIVSEEQAAALKRYADAP